MKFEEIKNDQTYEQIATSIGISKSNLWQQVNKRGFSTSTIKKLALIFPEIDIKDLLNSYPRD